jgi:hypothetical protein
MCTDTHTHIQIHTQLELWETQVYFQMLTEHAIRGLMLLGTPDPFTVLSGDTGSKGPGPAVRLGGERDTPYGYGVQCIWSCYSSAAALARASCRSGSRKDLSWLGAVGEENFKKGGARGWYRIVV